MSSSSSSTKDDEEWMISAMEFVGLEDKYEYQKNRLTLYYNKHAWENRSLHNSDMNIIFRQNVKNIHQMSYEVYQIAK